jgi:quercetin dioxygenase-like cupin family protein
MTVMQKSRITDRLPKESAMHIIRGGRAGRPSEQKTATFTGTVWGDPVLPQTDDVLINSVSFSPGARTYWHTHDGGQILIVTSGAGQVWDRDGQGGEITVGDIVYIGPDVEHWHGARADTTMTHLAISLKGHDWRDEVTEDEIPAPGA